MRGQPVAVTRSDAAAYLGVSPSYIDRAIATGNLPVRYAGTKPLIPFPALLAWFEQLPDTKPQ